MIPSKTEKLLRFYEQFSGEDHVLVLINADPDAIASAMAVKRLLWRKVASVAIAHTNVIKRPDNLTMIRVLGVNMTHVDEVEAGRHNRIVMVDSQPSHGDVMARYQPSVIIDHHPESGAVASFCDIRPKYGATASIMTEYLRAARIKPSVKLATGLFFAIKNDTSNFERQTLIEDLRAFQFLFRYANPYLVRRIEQAELKPEFLKYFKLALETKRMRKGKAYVDLGPVVNPDVCVLIADFFMRVTAVKWTIVSGRHNKKLIVVFRNDGIRKNAGKVAKESFGQLGSAGGHKSMARAEVPLADLKEVVDGMDSKKLSRWIVQQVERRTTQKARTVKPKPNLS
jgi:nanoRNase/pAp phosphatase (c-di-AMP/oligoRNAs hydrolase)